MQPLKPETIPLTTDEKEWLMQIYTLRHKNLASRFLKRIVNVAMMLFCIFYFFGFIFNVFIGALYGAQINMDFFANFGVKLLVILCMAIVTSVADYYFWSLPFKKDALSGVKYWVPFTVAKKEYFEITDQYFVWLEGYKERHYEIEKKAYDNCEEGGVLWLGQGIKSKYIFCFNDHIVVKLDWLTVQRRSGEKWASDS